MPTIEEVNDDAPGNTPPSSSSSSNASGNNSSTNGTTGGQSGFGKVVAYLTEFKVDAALWASRLATVVCSILYVFPLLGHAASLSCYQRALILNGLTSALRLHQRMPPLQFNRMYLGQLLLEDSCHNLLYSLIFINSYPLTFVLTPVFLFALLHASSFTKKLANIAGPNSMPLLRRLVDKIISHQVDILRFIALDEILIMPVLIFMMATGRMSLIAPFMYFRFLTFRYASRRNPYCKQIFHELRLRTEQYCSQPNTPAFLSNFLTKCINMLGRFAPQDQYQQQQQQQQ
ncbi:transmembrane protein 33-like [Lytechinus variegatus]|uniref:transmembrane protein 33-like n=1 Tax=Lytechinus variegatus TaxID=7654 RepID=UPI001BB23891|nr:transmembrane protein 33-like [Lytechinus variegatus]